MRGVIFYKVFGHFCCDHINMTDLVEQRIIQLLQNLLQNKTDISEGSRTQQQVYDWSIIPLKNVTLDIRRHLNSLSRTREFFIEDCVINRNLSAELSLIHSEFLLSLKCTTYLNYGVYWEAYHTTYLISEFYTIELVSWLKQFWPKSCCNKLSMFSQFHNHI